MSRQDASKCGNVYEQESICCLRKKYILPLSKIDKLPTNSEVQASSWNLPGISQIGFCGHQLTHEDWASSDPHPEVSNSEDKVPNSFTPDQEHVSHTRYYV